MPRTPRNHLDRFVSAVHRRHVATRLAEFAGVGALAGAAVGLAALPVLAWRGTSPAVACAAAVGAGALAGGAWAVTVRRPSRVRSAAEADRQLGSADLLATALLVRRRPDDPWAAAVSATAEHWVAGRRPVSVRFERFGQRLWAAVGLAVSLLVVLCAFVHPPATPRDAEASGGRAAANAVGTTGPVERPLLTVAASPALRSAGPGTSPDEDGGRPGLSAPTEVDDPNAGNPEASPGEKSSPGGASGDSTGGGTGSGQSQPKRGTPASGDPPTGTDATATTGGDGTPAAGAGRATGATDGSTGTARGSAAGARGAPRWTPPWQTDQWPVDVARAEAALKSGQVPPGYRDLVRRYFERE